MSYEEQKVLEAYRCAEEARWNKEYVARPHTIVTGQDGTEYDFGIDCDYITGDGVLSYRLGKPESVITVDRGSAEMANLISIVSSEIDKTITAYPKLEITSALDFLTAYRDCPTGAPVLRLITKPSGETENQYGIVFGPLGINFGSLSPYGPRIAKDRYWEFSDEIDAEKRLESNRQAASSAAQAVSSFVSNQMQAIVSEAVQFTIERNRNSPLLSLGLT